MRKLLILLAAVAIVAATDTVSAQEFKPPKPVEIVAHTAPGGGGDLMARAIASIIEKEKLLPVRMVVLNKPGGGTSVAMAYLAEKKGDVHTIGIFNTTWVTDSLVNAETRAVLSDLKP